MITKADIKLLESQVMTDNDDGGGRITGNEIVDGQVNNVFTDISRFDRTLGRFSTRKVFAAVTKDGQDTYFGSHIVITDPPIDNNVSVTMFTTNSPSDRRVDSSNIVESYVIRGVLSRWRLYGTQTAGQKIILAFSQESAELPTIGDVITLVENEDLGNEFFQFVKITSFDHSIQVFTDGQGNYNLRVLIIGISDALRDTYTGVPPSRKDAIDNSSIKKTTVADIAHYYGVKKLASDAVANDLSLNVESIYNNLVPSSQAETALADILASGTTPASVPNGTAIGLKINTPGSISISDRFIANAGLKPGTVKITVNYSTSGGSVFNRIYRDDSLGNFIATSEGTSSPGNDGDYFIADYKVGIIESNISIVQSASVFLDAELTTEVIDIGQTDSIVVDLSNRSTTYVKTLSPIPTPGSLFIDYMALGNWFRLVDDGTGNLQGEQTGTGTASINFITGTVIVTLAALPDIDSSILFGWGTGVHYTQRAGDIDIKPPVISHTVPEGAITAGSLTLTWTSGGLTKTATDDSAGNITGDATGRVVYSQGAFFMEPNVLTALPDPSSNIVIDYDHTTTVTENISVTKDGAGFLNFSLSQSPVTPRTLRIDFQTEVAEKKFVFGSVSQQNQNQLIRLI